MSEPRPGIRAQPVAQIIAVDDRDGFGAHAMLDEHFGGISGCDSEPDVASLRVVYFWIFEGDDGSHDGMDSAHSEEEWAATKLAAPIQQA